MYICICKKITDTQIYQEIEKGATTLKELSEQLGVSTQCGKCGKCARNMIRHKVSDMASFPADAI
jgi:bacterioferritin-associated ferredoxin